MSSLNFFPPEVGAEMFTGAGAVTASSAKAAQACVPCRRQKRKCDKDLPKCGLCSRMGRLCDYTDVQQAPTVDDLMSVQIKLVELERRLNQKEQHNGSSVALPPALDAVSEKPPLWMPAQSRFPSAMFLDMECFSCAGLSVPKPAVEIPKDVLGILGSTNAVAQAVKNHFNTIHCWFPIISKKRMNMAHSLYEGAPDLAMLILAMKLVSSQPVNGVASAEHHHYVASKRFLALLESSGTISITYLQAMVFVAIYEFGHSIYPAAWMSIGACSRYAEILGLPSSKDSEVILGRATTWAELEERRRVWWGLFVLDRVICMGNKRRPAASEPGRHEILPMNDTSWDEGDVANTLQSTASTPFSDPQPPFARLCQAAVLIDRVESHIQATLRRHKTRDSEPFPTQEIDSLINDLTSFSTIVGSELAAAGADISPPATDPSPRGQQQHSLPDTFLYPSPVFPDARAATQSSSPHSRAPQPRPPFPATTGPDYAIASLLQPRFLALSALILLYDLYCCPADYLPGSTTPASFPKTPAALRMQARAVAGMRGASLAVRDAGVELLEFAMLPNNLARVGPLVLDGVYAAMATLRWLWAEEGGGGGEEEEEESGDKDGVGRALEDVKRTLAGLDMRWRLARDYLGLERYQPCAGAAAGAAPAMEGRAG